MQGQRRALQLQILLLVYLQGDEMASLPVHATLDAGEGALPDLQANLEVVDLEHLLRPWSLCDRLPFLIYSPLVVFVDHAHEALSVLFCLAAAIAIDQGLRGVVGECHASGGLVGVQGASSRQQQVVVSGSGVPLPLQARALFDGHLRLPFRLRVRVGVLLLPVAPGCHCPLRCSCVALVSLVAGVSHVHLLVSLLLAYLLALLFIHWLLVRSRLLVLEGYLLVDELHLDLVILHLDLVTPTSERVFAFGGDDLYLRPSPLLYVVLL